MGKVNGLYGLIILLISRHPKCAVTENHQESTDQNQKRNEF